MGELGAGGFAVLIQVFPASVDRSIVVPESTRHMTSGSGDTASITTALLRSRRWAVAAVLSANGSTDGRKAGAAGGATDLAAFSTGGSAPGGSAAKLPSLRASCDSSLACAVNESTLAVGGICLVDASGSAGAP